MKFTGWADEALEFYEGLEADNTKTYWTRNKHVYDEHVLAPMLALIAELEPTWGEGKVFRPYRDVRFSKDKTPYKTNIGARIGGGYVQLDASGLMVGSGRFHLESAEVQRFRQAIDNDVSGKQLVSIVSTARKKGYEANSHDELKTVPRGFDRDHPRAELLKYKGLIIWRRWDPAAWLGTAAAKKRVTDLFTAAKPLNDWLGQHVGG
ncbi:MAG TPA: DUF2461 domain-containing protein [Mycobacteriales bacterium]|nr:DUF2461 domain-containing protein [Mycobacteriales bacterium]